MRTLLVGPPLVFHARQALPLSLLLLVAPVAAPDPTSVARLPHAQVSLDVDHGVMVVELPPVDLPASTPGSEFMTGLPVYQAVIPDGVSLYQVGARVVDSAGQELPKVLLHHMNLTDPGRRDLFLPTSMHLLAASKETPALRIPSLLVGLPLVAGQQLIVTGMLANPTTTPYHGARAQMVFRYRPLGAVFPLFRAYPWVLDAQFPSGERVYGRPAFDLPPGRSAFSWESSPAIAGYIVGAGGHVHDYAVSLELSDVTTGERLWRGEPVRDATGHVVAMPIGLFYNWHRLGVHILPTHRYRVTVTYDNPTGRLLPRAAMGSVAGLFIPDAGTQWPTVDTTNAVYRRDLNDVLNAMTGPMEM